MDGILGMGDGDFNSSDQSVTINDGQLLGCIWGAVVESCGSVVFAYP